MYLSLYVYVLSGVCMDSCSGVWWSRGVSWCCGVCGVCAVGGSGGACGVCGVCGGGGSGSGSVGSVAHGVLTTSASLPGSRLIGVLRTQHTVYY